MRVGIHLPHIGRKAGPEAIRRAAIQAEELGFADAWTSEHIIIPKGAPYPPSALFYDPFLTLTWAAAFTKRIRLGTSVLVLPMRHPLPLAKELATLQNLSEGRLILGAGVGWMREEIELLGAPFDQRGAWSDEAIRIMRACWRDARTSFDGRFFSFKDMGCYPKPVRGDIPIWMGGHAKPALRRIVALADGWHAAFPTADGLAAGLHELREECARQRRPFEELTITLRAGLALRPSPSGSDRKALQGTADEIVGDLRRFKALGVSHVLLEGSYRDLSRMIATFEAFARDIRPHI